MSQSTADRLIKRISALHRSLQLDEGGQLSTMERDLMLGYLRELYEIYATHQEGKPYTPPAVSSTPPQPPPPPAPKPAPAPAPAAKTVESKAVEQSPVAPTPPVTPPTPPTPPSTPPPAAAQVSPPPAATVVPPPPAYRPPSPPAASDPSLKGLFVDEAPASRFGRQPLKDLTKGLTINTRILFSRELFGDDNELLNTSLRTLDTAGSFAAAQPVLESMARRFDWANEAKAETAREFIELVRRRYA